MIIVASLLQSPEQDIRKSIFVFGIRYFFVYDITALSNVN